MNTTNKKPAPTPWGPQHDAFLQKIKSELAKLTNAEIEKLLEPDNLPELYQTFGYAPLAWRRGTDILRAELKRRHLLRDTAAPVSADMIRRELAPVMKVAKDTSASVRAVGQREADLTRQLKAVAPQVAADRSKAIVAWMKQLQCGCSEIEKKAAILRIEGMTLSEIAKRLPHKKGKAMTRQGVKQVLLRFETKSGQPGLFSKGTYRDNVRIESEAKESDEDGEYTTDS